VIVKGCPKISIVTTNYNGAKYLEETIQSVLNQTFKNIEYIIIDGGSTDGSQEIIEKYEEQLAYWESKKDRGFAHAYNKGFSKTTGDILAYLNSDDLYCPWAFEIVARCFIDLPEIEWLTSLFPMLHSNRHGFVYINPAQPFNKALYYAGFYGRKLGFIQQESTFWTRRLWKKSGSYFDENLDYAIDAELWARFFQHADLYAVSTTLGGFRYRSDSKSGLHLNKYCDEMFAILKKYKKDAANLSGVKSINRIVKLFPLRTGNITYYGKVVKWDLKSEKYFAEDTQIIY